jgi:hypothetical protein
LWFLSGGKQCRSTAAALRPWEWACAGAGNGLPHLGEPRAWGDPRW